MRRRAIRAQHNGRVQEARDGGSASATRLPGVDFLTQLTFPLAVSSGRRLVPPCRLRVPGTRTDSHRPLPRRGAPKGAFRGTYTCFAVWHRRTKYREAVSSGQRARGAPDMAVYRNNQNGNLTHNKSFAYRASTPAIAAATSLRQCPVFIVSKLLLYLSLCLTLILDV